MVGAGNSFARIDPLEGERKPEVFLSTPFREAVGAFSPDGHWLAYASSESGRSEVYVRPIPPGGGKWQVSMEGAAFRAGRAHALPPVLP